MMGSVRIRRARISDADAISALNNRFADQVGRLEVRYQAFMEEFSSILQRHASRGGTGASPVGQSTATMRGA